MCLMLCAPLDWQYAECILYAIREGKIKCTLYLLYQYIKVETVQEYDNNLFLRMLLEVMLKLVSGR